MGCLVAPAVAPGGRGSTVPLCPFLSVGMVSNGSAWFEGVETVESGSDLAGRGPAGGEAEPHAQAAADDAPGEGEQPQAEPVGFPPAGGPVRASICIQASSPQARAMISHQIRLWA